MAKEECLEMEGVVPKKERSERSKMLRSLSEKKRRYFYEQQIGKPFNVLFEKDVERGKIHGFTENYVRVAVKYNPALINVVCQVELKEIGSDGIMNGNLIEETIAV